MSKEYEKLYFKVRYSGSSSNVIKAVLLKKVPAGATLDSEFEKEPFEVRRQLRPIFTTPKHPPHPLAARPEIPSAVRRSIEQAILKFGSTETDAEMLKAVRLLKPVIADYNKDYQDLEDIDTRKLSSGESL